MTRLLSRIWSPAPLLFVFVFITQFAYGMYLGAQLPFPEEVTLINAVGMLWATGWWLQTDSRRKGVLSVYDPGFFLFLAWPIVMSYYLVKTRGAKGLLVILGFVVVYIGAGWLGAILSMVVIAPRS